MKAPAHHHTGFEPGTPPCVCVCVGVHVCVSSGPFSAFAPFSAIFHHSPEPAMLRRCCWDVGLSICAVPCSTLKEKRCFAPSSRCLPTVRRRSVLHFFLRIESNPLLPSHSVVPRFVLLLPGHMWWNPVEQSPGVIVIGANGAPSANALFWPGPLGRQ